MTTAWPLMLAITSGVVSSTCSSSQSPGRHKQLIDIESFIIMTRNFERKDNDKACTEDSDFRQCTYWYLRLARAHKCVTPSG